MKKKIVGIRGALARGYCTKENQYKELDSDLLNAQAVEIEALIEQENVGMREALEGVKIYLSGQECECDEDWTCYRCRHLAKIDAVLGGSHE